MSHLKKHLLYSSLFCMFPGSSSHPSWNLIPEACCVLAPYMNTNMKSLLCTKWFSFPWHTCYSYFFVLSSSFTSVFLK